MGYYWEKYQLNLPNGAAHTIIYNHTFYPNTNAGTCVNGTDYPSWMASETAYIRFYLFKNDPQGCCKYWFGEGSVDNCVRSIIHSPSIDANSIHTADVTTMNQLAVNQTEGYLKMWYPVLEEKKCKKDGLMLPWMLGKGYREW